MNVEPEAIQALRDRPWVVSILRCDDNRQGKPVYAIIAKNGMAGWLTLHPEPVFHRRRECICCLWEDQAGADFIAAAARRVGR